MLLCFSPVAVAAAVAVVQFIYVIAIRALFLFLVAGYAIAVQRENYIDVYLVEPFLLSQCSTARALLFGLLFSFARSTVASRETVAPSPSAESSGGELEEEEKYNNCK